MPFWSEFKILRYRSFPLRHESDFKDFFGCRMFEGIDHFLGWNSPLGLVDYYRRCPNPARAFQGHRETCSLKTFILMGYW